VNPARVIGIGSSFGADRIGWEVVDALARPDSCSGWPPGRVVFSRCARPDGELLAALERPGLVLLIDAMRSGAPAGTVRRVGAEEIMQGGTLISSHGFGINSAVGLAAALGNLAAEVRICGIEIPPASAQEAVGAAPVMAAVREQILSEIRIILMESLRECGYL
jgi:hydrogenase maturation protease